MILRAFLFVLALANAAGRRLFRLGLPAIPKSQGWRRRLALATMVAMGSFFAGGEDLNPGCYLFPQRVSQPNFTDKVRTIWATLDTKKIDEFSQALDAVVANKDGKLTAVSAKALRDLYWDLAVHRQKRELGVKCYFYATTSPDGVRISSLDSILMQINCLRQAKAKGAVDDATLVRVAATLARSIEALNQAKLLPDNDRLQSDALLKSLTNDKLTPPAEAAATANLVLGLESFSLPARIKPAKTPQAAVKMTSKQAYDILMKTEAFGFMPVNANRERLTDTAFQTIIFAPNAKETFATLFADGPIQAKLFALCAIRHLDEPLFNQLSKKINKDDKIRTQFGDQAGETTAGKVIEELKKGLYDLYFQYPR